MPLGKEYERKLAFNRLIVFMNKNAERVNYNRVDRGCASNFLQTKLKVLLDGQSLYADLRHQYMAYALALAKTQDRLKFMVDFIREHQILRDRFERRKLDATVLDAIDKLVIYRSGDE